jgi:hypothetical protein
MREVKVLGARTTSSLLLDYTSCKHTTTSMEIVWKVCALVAHAMTCVQTHCARTGLGQATYGEVERCMWQNHLELHVSAVHDPGNNAGATTSRRVYTTVYICP